MNISFQDYQMPWVESPFLRQELDQRSGISEEDKRRIIEFNRDGFTVLRGLINDEECGRVVADLGPVFATDPSVLKENRLQDGWKAAESVRRIAADSRLLTFLEVMYGRPVVPFQTLNFKFGSEQRPHADSIHFSSLPSRFMCGVWVALEDVTANNGPLVYYPGSHRLPELMPYHLNQTAAEFRYLDYEDMQSMLMDAGDFRPLEFHAKKGDALIWASNIVHGGRPITEPGSTRWSQVTHYFFEDCIYITPMHSNMNIGEYFVRDQLQDVRTGANVPMTYNGREIHITPVDDQRSRISFDRRRPADRVADGALRAARKFRGRAGELRRRF